MCDSRAIRTTFSSKKIITKNLENSNSNILEVYWAPNLNTVHLVKSSNLCLSWEFFIFRIPSSMSSSLWPTTYIFPFYFVLLDSCCRRWLQQWSKFPGFWLHILTVLLEFSEFHPVHLVLFGLPHTYFLFTLFY